MVKAELTYNPYLLETEVRFNGQSPRINSLVEKYQKGMLETWIGILPKVFYDEMNGYNFELDFSGTKLDFEEVTDAFRSQGVNEDQVHIFFKNEMDDRLKKTAMIDTLNQWLRNNRNDRFDADAFFEKYADLFDATYPYILMYGQETDQISFESIKVTGEIVNHTEELDQTDLTHTPILFCLNRQTVESIQRDLSYFLKRQDVAKNQLFFMVHPFLNQDQIERVIRDLGIASPQMVQSASDDKILKYMKLYPVSDFIHLVIQTFRSYTDKMETQMQEELEKSKVTNQEIHLHILQKEQMLEKLKTAQFQFMNRNNLDQPTVWADMQEKLLFFIMSWRNNKTKITGEADGERIAGEFRNAIVQETARFCMDFENEVESVKDAILEEYHDWYAHTEIEPDFSIDTIEMDSVSGIELPAIEEELIKLNTTEYLPARNDFVGRFFASVGTEPKDLIPTTVYYYQNWREYVRQIVKPLAEHYVEQYYNNLSKYCSEVADSYISQLEMLTRRYEKEKAEVSSQLSEEEMILQRDQDWLICMCDQISAIERG